MGQTTEELSTDIAGTREALAADLDALQDRVSPSAIIGRRKEAARGRVSGIRSKVMGSAQDTRRSAASGTSEAVGSVKDSAHGAVGSVGSRVEGSPLAAGLVAFGAGMVISALLPATEAESRAAQAIGDAASEHGKPLVEEAKAMGQDLGQQLKESATGKVQDLKESGEEAVAHVSDEGRTSASHVRSTSQG